LAENISLQRSNCNIFELTKPGFFRLRVFFEASSLENEVGDPNFFCFGFFDKSRSLPFCMACQLNKYVRETILGANFLNLLKLNMHLNLFSVSTEPEALALPTSSYNKNSVSGSTELILYTTLSAILCILMIVAVAIFLKRRNQSNEENKSK